METISNVANAAVKAVWGEQETNKEPVSGVSGDVSKGEPYDAGNLGKYLCPDHLKISTSVMGPKTDHHP